MTCKWWVSLFALLINLFVYIQFHLPKNIYFKDIHVHPKNTILTIKMISSTWNSSKHVWIAMFVKNKNYFHSIFWLVFYLITLSSLKYVLNIFQVIKMMPQLKYLGWSIPVRGNICSPWWRQAKLYCIIVQNK